MGRPNIKLLPANVNFRIEGRMVVMRPITDNDITERYLSWLNDPKVNQFLDVVRHKKQSIEDVVGYINSLRSRPGCELFAVFTKKEGIHIGNMGVSVYNPHQQGYAGYGLMIGNPQARMLGLGGEVQILTVEFLFRDSVIRRIHGNVYSENEKSWKTLESLGFQREGVLRQHVVLSDGRICDRFAYGLLRSEWAAQRDKFHAVLKDAKITQMH